MAQLIVRKLEDSVVQRLRQRAAANGRSAEEEHRAILRAALTRRSKQTFKDILGAMPDVGADEDFTPPRDRPRRVKL